MDKRMDKAADSSGFSAVSVKSDTCKKIPPNFSEELGASKTK